MTISTSFTLRRAGIRAAIAATAVVGAAGAIQAPAHASAVGDNFNAPTFLAGVHGGITLSNVGATAEPGEPSHSTSISGVKDLPDHSIWFRWKSPITGRAVFRTRGSTFDTVMAAYTGTSLTGLTKVTDNDDTTFARPGGGADELQSQIGFDAVKDTTYNIAVDSFTGNRAPDDVPTGKVKLSWDANDNFANARALPTSTTQTLIQVGDNTGATRQNGEPVFPRPGGAKPADATIWYSFKAPKAGRVQFNTFGSEVDTMLAAYKGSSVSALTLLSSDNDVGPDDGFDLPVTTGQVIKISIDGVKDVTDEGIVVLQYGYVS